PEPLTEVSNDPSDDDDGDEMTLEFPGPSMLDDHQETDPHFSQASMADLKVVVLLMGLQLEYAKYCCFLCEWDSRAHFLYCVKKDWPLRKSLKIGEKNVQHSALAEPDNILLPPLHIKPGLMKNLVKAMDRNGSAFKYLSENFPWISEAKIKDGIFVDPQIHTS
ncbi:hypothetical protein P4O66_015230, partial [Electrophorus voltai]